jgi:F plasmid transfer operon, TraF, protein
MRSLVFTLIFVPLASTALAQSESPAGVRATGMGGAFVAVADDASAVFWNPAGLATGSYFSVALDWNQLQTPDDTSFPHQRSAFMLALGMPAFGLSYFTNTVTRISEAVPTNPAGFVRAERLVARHIGATLVQSIGSHIAIGGTAKLVRGEASAGRVTLSNPDILDAADLFPREATTKFDTDIGVIVSGPVAKAGVAVRNLFEPDFAVPDGVPITLERRIRGGVSLLLLQAVTVSADVDFTKADTTLGEWRDAAVGAEARLARRAWVRGGVHWNTAGDDGGPGAAPVASIGGSYAVYGSVLADGQVSMGSENGDKGWGIGLRFVF